MAPLLRCILTLCPLLMVMDSFSQRNYYQYKNEVFGFSFTCPEGWQYQPDTIPSDTDRAYGKFVPTDPRELKHYQDCYDGIIFHVEIIPKSLNETLLKDGLYSKVNGKYYAHYQFMLSDSLEADPIRGNAWTGIHHISTCRIHCKEDDVTPLVEGCETLYFSNDKLTVNFSTTGETLPADVYQAILSSFRFH